MELAYLEHQSFDDWCDHLDLDPDEDDCDLAAAMESIGEQRKPIFVKKVSFGRALVTLPQTAYLDSQNVMIPYAYVIEHLPGKFEADEVPHYTETTNKPIKENRMNSINTQNIMSKFFVQVAGVVLDLQSGSLGIKTADGIVTLNKDTNSCQVNPFEAFSMAIPAYAIRTPLEDLEVGDIVLQDEAKAPVFVIGGSPNLVKAITPTGMVIEFSPVKNLLFGQEGVMVVKNIYAGMGAGATNPMMQMLLMKEMTGGSSFGDDKLGLFLAMQAMGGGAATGGFDMKSMLPMLLLGGGGLDTEKLLMMQMMGGGFGFGK